MTFALAAPYRELLTDHTIAAIRKRKPALSSSRADCLFFLHHHRRRLFRRAPNRLSLHDVEAMLLNPLL
jgi:hypothetical protein